MLKGLLLSVACVLMGMPEVAGVRTGIETGVASSRLQAWRSLQQEAALQAAAGYSHAWSGVERSLTLGPLAYSACILGTVAVVVLLYWTRSAAEICSIVVYLLALSSVRLAVKAVFVGCRFNFPLAVSSVHFMASAVAAFGVLIYRSLAKGQAVPVPTRSEFLFTILPIALCFATCIGVGNKVLELCSVALSEILMATQPIMSVPFVMMLGMPFDLWLLLPTCLVVAGCVLCSLGDVHFSVLGLALAVLSNVLRAAKASLQQKMLTGEKRETLDPCALLAWMSVPSAALMLAWSAVAEGRAPVQQLLAGGGRGWTTAGAVVLSSAPAAVLNLSQLLVVAGLGAVGSQIVAQLKIVLTIMGGVVLLSEKVVPMQAAGFLGVLVGAFFYSRWDQASKPAAPKQQAHG